MFVARVLTGRQTEGHQNHFKPERVDPDDPRSQRFDSCTDKSGHVHVIFDSSQVYPEFIIEYEREAD